MGPPSPLGSGAPTWSERSHWLPTSSNEAMRSVAGRSWPVVQKRTASMREKSSSSSPPRVSRFSVRTGMRSRYHVSGWPVTTFCSTGIVFWRNGLLASPASSSGMA